VKRSKPNETGGNLTIVQKHSALGGYFDFALYCCLQSLLATCFGLEAALFVVTNQLISPFLLLFLAVKFRRRYVAFASLRLRDYYLQLEIWGNMGLSRHLKRRMWMTGSTESDSYKRL